MLWYKKSLKRNLIDMHINDINPAFMSEFDPQKYAEAMSLAGVDTSIIYAGSCLGINYFKTENGHVHNSLAGRDIVGETVDAVKAKGIDVILYLNMWSRWAYDNHPDWRMVDAEGRGYLVDFGHRYGTCCPNTGYFDYVMKLFTDLVYGYECVGYWIDMFGWIHNVCYCEGCKKRFLEETGNEIPTVINWDDEVFKLFVHKREIWATEMAYELNLIVKRKDPNLTITQQTASWPMGWLSGDSKEYFQCSDYLAGDYDFGVSQSTIIKYMANITPNKPIEYMTARCDRLSEHVLIKPDFVLASQWYSSMASNAAFTFIDAIDPVGTIDERVYTKMGRIFAEGKKFEKYVDIEAELLADVGLIISQSALYNLNSNGKPANIYSGPPYQCLENTYKATEAFVRNNIAFDVMDFSKPEKLNKMKVVALCGVPYITDEEADMLREYVKNGGCLYVSGQTSVMDGKFKLADIFGVDYLGTEDDNFNYIAPLPQYEEVFGDFSGKYPITVDGTFTKVKLNGNAEVMAVTSNCWYKYKDIHMFSSAITDPPAPPTDKPAIIKNRYGKGCCIYSCGAIESINNMYVQNAFTSLIMGMTNTKPLIITDTPWQIEAQVFRNGKKMSVNFNYFLASIPPTPVYNINVKLFVGDKEVESVLDVGLGKEIGFEICDRYLKTQVSEVLLYNTLQIKLK
ncbi:MAG: alpha-L-fucosidase [Oscillospiraceae bacterium]|nr:alpha-L-fucosidase [Oscillospiraceae bacterium]